MTDFGRCDSRSATREENRSEKTLAALRMLQESRGSAAVVAGTRQDREIWGRENFQRSALEDGFQIWEAFACEEGGVR